MSYTVKGILGAVAVSLMFGVAQFASGHDLGSGIQSFSGLQPTEVVNRAAKADRGATVMSPSAPTRTISFKLDGLDFPTSRTGGGPPDAARRNETPAWLPVTSGERKPTLACEPVVS